MLLILNIALFQLGWFACVLGAAKGWPWVGVIAAVMIVTWHLARAVTAKKEIVLLAIAFLLGALFETLLVQTAWIHFFNGNLIPGIAPYWMVALWVIFATTLNVSLRSLRERWGLAAILGALGGPIAYYAGARLGALEFVSLGAALSLIGVGWGILTPVLFEVARRFDGYARA